MMIQFGIPQIIFLALWVMSLTIHLVKDGEDTDIKYSFFGKLLAISIQLGLLIWGGFFS